MILQHWCGGWYNNDKFYGGLKMKKILTIIFVPMFIFVFLPLSFSQQRQALPVRLQKISENLFEVLDGRGARGGVYVGENAVLVIDAKMDKTSVDETIGEIKKITDKPIKFLVNTHSDGDHTSGNVYFPDTVTFIAHKNCRKEMLLPNRDGSPSKWNEPELAPFMPSITFSDRMDIYIGPKKIELWYFGVGHTTSDLVVYFPEEKTAFIGDQIFLTRTQLIHSYKGGNSFEHVKTLEKMLQTLDAEKFCSGHSNIADRSTVTEHIKKMKALQEKVKSLIEANKNLDEIKKEFPEDHLRLIESIYNEIKSNKTGDG
jgi:glyoxylase-like metal-dependent hydrolase (beta-lactamase superfamily II)